MLKSDQSIQAEHFGYFPTNITPLVLSCLGW